jgi:hypothetical protein
METVRLEPIGCRHSAASQDGPGARRPAPDLAPDACRAVQHCVEEDARHEAKDRRRRLGALEGGDHGRAELALGDLPAIARHPVRRRRVVDREGWFVERHPVNGGQRACSFERDQGPGAQPKHVVRARRGEQRVEVFALGRQAVPLPRRAAHTTPTAVRHVHGEGVRQGRGQLAEVLGGLHAAVDQDDARAVPELAVSDGRSVARDDGADGVRRWSWYSSHAALSWTLASCRESPVAPATSPTLTGAECGEGAVGTPSSRGSCREPE